MQKFRVFVTLVKNYTLRSTQHRVKKQFARLIRTTVSTCLWQNLQLASFRSSNFCFQNNWTEWFFPISVRRLLDVVRSFWASCRIEIDCISRDILLPVQLVCDQHFFWPNCQVVCSSLLFYLFIIFAIVCISYKI